MSLLPAQMKSVQLIQYQCARSLHVQVNPGMDLVAPSVPSLALRLRLPRVHRLHHVRQNIHRVLHHPPVKSLVQNVHLVKNHPVKGPVLNFHPVQNLHPAKGLRLASRLHANRRPVGKKGEGKNVRTVHRVPRTHACLHHAPCLRSARLRISNPNRANLHPACLRPAAHHLARARAHRKENVPINVSKRRVCARFLRRVLRSVFPTRRHKLAGRNVQQASHHIRLLVKKTVGTYCT